MPDMTGTELVAAIKSREYNIPTMILTGAQQPPAGSETTDLDLIEVVTRKPF